MPNGFEFIGLQLGYLIWWPIAALIIVPGTIWGVHSLKKCIEAKRAGEDLIWLPDRYTILAWLVDAAVLVAVLATVASAVPFNPRYWSYYSVSATVEDVSNVIVDASGTLSQVPVATLVTENGESVYVHINDSRVVNMVGLDTTLRCSVEWVYQAADRYNCVVAGQNWSNE